MTAERASKASQAAYDLCKYLEDGDTPSLKAYQKLGDVVTIGWGYTGKIQDKLTGQLRKLRLGDVITLEEADLLFDKNAAPEAERRVDLFFPHIALTQGQRDALFLLCYNLRWQSIEDSTLRKLLNAGEWDRETLIEWWVKYRNPKTQFEEGLYRRRITELSVFFDCDPKVAEECSREAELRRDPSTKEIIRQTDPELIILRAEIKTEAKQIADAELRRAEAEASRPADVTPVPPSPGTDAPKPVGATPSPIKEEGLPEIVPVKPKAPAPKKAAPGQPATSVENDIRADPRFWTMVILVLGRVSLAAGFIPAMFTDVINSKDFQVALGGIIAIYVAMMIAHIQQKQNEKREADRIAAEAEEQESEARLAAFLAARTPDASPQ